MDRYVPRERRITRGPDRASASRAPDPDRPPLPEWPALWAGCWRRIRAWRRPPHWSPGDWYEEMHAQGLAASWQARCDYDPARDVPLSAFARRRVLSSARTRYRQEWSYAVRCSFETPADGGAGPPATAPSAPDVYEALQGLLTRLADPDRRLIERLFWGGRTEADVAGELGISQSGVSRRKRAIILGLRHSFRIFDEEMEEFRS